MSDTIEHSLDARRIHAPLWLVFGLLSTAAGAAFWGGAELRSTRLSIEGLVRDLDQRPTRAEVELSAVRALRPIEGRLAEIGALLEMLDRRVQRLETPAASRPPK